MVGRTTYQYMRAGVAAFHIEDQVVNKRCGHLGNKLLVDEDEFISRIQAAANMRKKSNGDIVIIARSDALQSYGYDEAVRRLKSASKAGADMLFFEGLTSKEQCRKACQELAPTPVLLNMLSGGITPEISAAEAAEIGFKVVIFPTVALEPVYKAVAKAMATLKETGSIEAVTGAEAASMEELFESCGLKEAMEFDIAAGGHMYAKGV